MLAYVPINDKHKLKNKCLYPSVCVYNNLNKSIASGVIVRSDKREDYYYNVALACEHFLLDDNRLNPDSIRVKIPVFNKSKILFYQDYPCFIYEKNKHYDFAIIVFISPQKLKCAEFNFNSELEISDDIMKIGCGLGDDPRIDYGIITSLDGTLNEQKNLYRTNAFTIFGDSGGPVYHNYKLIGLTQGIRSVGTNPIFDISFVSPVDNFKSWEKEQPEIGFISDIEKNMPQLPIYFLEFDEWIVENK